MRKRFVYFSLSLVAALAALIAQFSPPSAVAKRPSPDEQAEECRVCEEGCTLAYQSCTAETGGRGPGFGRCVRELQECRRSCDGRGGPCDSRTDPAPSPTDPIPSPTASPTPVPTPD